VVNANKSVTNFNSTDSQANLVSTSDEATAKDAAKNEQNHWLQIEKNKIIKTIQKKKKAIQEISLQVHSEAAQNWLRLGEGLKYYQTPPEDLKDLYDTSRSRSENMEKAFQKYKDLERKKTGSLQRIQILNEEIIKLENSLLNDKLLMSESKSKTGTRQASNLMSKANVAGRKFQLEDGTEIVIGRSAKDNLNLLRKAQPTDLWLHLKDYPGSHAIVFKVNKNQNLTTMQVHQITEWLVKESLKNKSLMIGTFDVLVVEVRFVKPIKGDKLGRVTYQNEKTFTVTIKK
jgi:predicted ribosome quality control (RQC) complex YloA/Tae2 family protein